MTFTRAAAAQMRERYLKESKRSSTPITFGTLHGEKIENLIAAGRCISVTDSMWDITRVIPVCAVSGEAAGTAAAMTDNFKTLDISELQATLKERGVHIK